MAGFHTNIEEKTLENSYFRQVLFTGPKSQLVVMSLRPGEDIGKEVHPETDQFIRVEAGEGKAVLDGEEFTLKEDEAIVIPAGTEHNVINTGEKEMKLYTIYSPPEHRDATVHKTKEEASRDHHD